MINNERAKEIFIALRLHLITEEYDYTKYGGKVRRAAVGAKEKAFFQRLTLRLVSEDAVRTFFLANMIEEYRQFGKISPFIGHYTQKKNFVVYQQWQAWWQSASYNVTQELNNISLDFKELIHSDGDVPEIYRLLLTNSISLKTILAIFCSLPKLKLYWKATNKDEFLFGPFLCFLDKASQLIEVNDKKIREVLDTKVKT